MTYPAVIFWILFWWAAVAPQRTLLFFLFASFAFGSLAVLPPEVTGGLSLLPKAMFTLLLVARLLSIPLLRLSRRLVDLARLENLGFLLAFLVISLLTTIFMPRLLEGTIDIIPLRIVRFASAEPLNVTSANFTQSVYLSISVSLTFASAFMARSPDFPQQFLSGLRIGGIVMLASGILDMTATAVGQSDLLEPFRNASYAMITNAEIAGVRRVVGLMPEASAYGSGCVVFAAALAFLRHLYPAGLSRLATSLIALALIGMALLSTSSSAYAGLVFFGMAYLLNIARRLVSSSPAGKSGISAELGVGFLSIVALLLVLITNPDAFDPLVKIVDEIIFNKASSDSFLERSFWNQVSWNAFWSTYGFGVGLGATRASNYFVAVISNTGFLASGCFFIFLLQTFLRDAKASAFRNEMVVALKLTIIPSLGMAALGSATPDFEPWLGLIFGAVTGLAMQADKTVPDTEYSSPIAPPYQGHINLNGIQ